METRKLTHHQNMAAPADAALLTGNDAICYSVLKSILHRPNRCLLTDHTDVIVCHSCDPYPVWVWIRASAPDAAVSAAAEALRMHLPAEAGYHYILTRDALARLSAADPYFAALKEEMGVLSYRCDRLLPPAKMCGGQFCAAAPEDTGLLAQMWRDAAYEMEGHRHDDAVCRDKVSAQIASGTLFVWRTDNGEIAAMTARADVPDTDFSKINSVYTLPQYRRRGYAQHLVHAVSDGIFRCGRTPILYTDAGYAASNDCYRAIGFAVVGQLCKVMH
ncbi:MAG: GNAT family N-acetyltransferase [Clostridia bacterium]|nr:GNAT family N-acetyltransferase [Clostridia bacterium]